MMPLIDGKGNMTTWFKDRLQKGRKEMFPGGTKVNVSSRLVGCL